MQAPIDDDDLTIDEQLLQLPALLRAHDEVGAPAEIPAEAPAEIPAESDVVAAPRFSSLGLTTRHTAASTTPWTVGEPLLAGEASAAELSGPGAATADASVVRENEAWLEQRSALVGESHARGDGWYEEPGGVLSEGEAAGEVVADLEALLASVRDASDSGYTFDAGDLAAEIEGVEDAGGVRLPSKARRQTFAGDDSPDLDPWHADGVDFDELLQTISELTAGLGDEAITAVRSQISIPTAHICTYA